MEKKSVFISKILKYFFMIVAFAFLAPIFVACGENDIAVTDIKFVHDDELVMVQGDTIDLRYEIKPAEATNKMVKFGVADVQSDNYITVDSNTGSITAKVRSDKTEVVAWVYVRTDYGNMSDTLKVKILGEKHTLDVPTNLRYDANTSSVVWDAVSETLVAYSPNYELEITKDGEQLETQTLTNNAFQVLESGVYNVRVKSVVSGDVYSNIYSNSDFSQVYEFEILKSATDGKIEDSKIKVTQIEDRGVNYELHVYKTLKTSAGTVRGDEISTASFVQSQSGNQTMWTVPQDFLAGTYEFDVKTTSTSPRVFNSIDFACVQFSKLNVPSNIYLDSNVLFWDKMDDATNYNVLVYSKTSGELLKTINSGFVRDGNVLKLNLNSQDISETDYNLAIKAVGNGREILDSDIASVTVNKLAKVENLTLVGTTLSWNAVSNATNYVIYLNGKNPITTNPEDENYETPISVLSPTLSCDVSNWNFVSDDKLLDGQTANVISIYAQTMNIKGDTTTLNVNKLANAVLKTINGNVGWNEVAGAQKYEMVVYDQDKQQLFRENEITDTTYSFSNDPRTRNAGKYIVTVRALGDGRAILDADEVVVTDENKNNFTFTKQDVPVILSFGSNGILSWTNGANSLSTATFEVGVFDTSLNEVINFFEVRENSCDLKQFLVGQSSGVLNYQFYVKTLNKLSNVLYLNSEPTQKVVAYKLDAPQNLRVLEGQFAWDAPDNAIIEMQGIIGYSILINNYSEILQENFDNRMASPTATQMYVGQSSVKIKSYIKQNSFSDNSNKILLPGENVWVYVLESDYTAAKSFTKLATPTKPYIESTTQSADYQRFVGRVVSNSLNYAVTLDVDNNGVVGSRKNYKTVSVDAGANTWALPISTLVDDTIDFGNYVVRVMALGGDNYINSNISSDGVAIYKLDIPQLATSNGKLSWNKVSSRLDNSYYPINDYEILYKKASDLTYESLRVEGNSWDMAGLDGGTYNVKIRAIGYGGSVISSAISLDSPIQKLSAVDDTTIKIVDPLDISLTDYYLNTITWDKADNYSEYRIKVYQVLPETVLKENKIVSTNNFTFDDSFDASKYYVTIQTVFENSVSGEETTPVYINRLNKVTGLSVAGSSDVVVEDSEGKHIKNQNYELSWSPVVDAASYTITVNGKEIKTVNATETSSHLIDSAGGLLNSQTGHLNLQVVAKISAYDLYQQNHELTISAVSSSVYPVYRNEAPTLNVSNGKLIINNTNSSDNNNGYTLIFVPTIGGFEVVYLDLPASARSYDMSDTILADCSQTFYNVSIIAKGSNGKIIQSEQKQFNQTSSSTAVDVGKLGGVEEINIVNGEVSWEVVHRAEGYTVSAIDDYSTLPVNTSNVNIISNFRVKMPAEAFAGLVGNITFTIQPQGTKGFSGNGEVLITSNVLNEFSVKKLPAPSGLRVVDGEICWNLNEEEDQGTRKVSSYNVLFGSRSENVGFSNNFTLSNFVGEHSLVPIQVCAIGSLNATNGGYVSSDYTSSGALIVEIGGKPIELDVINGVLCWKEHPSDTGTYSDYELELTLADGNQTIKTLRSTKNSNTLTDALSFGQDFESIRVRHIGTANSQTMIGRVHVNSQYSEYLYNVKKLDAITTIDVNEQGVLVWDHENPLTEIVLSLDQDEFTPTQSRSISNLLSIEMEERILQNGYASFNLSYYPQITNNRTSIETPLYVSGEKASFDAIKFAPVDDFGVNNGLNIAWKQGVMSVRGVSNDKIVLSYQYSKYGSGENGVNNAVWQEKSFNLSDISVDNSLSEFYVIPMWDLGYYNFKISVVSTNTETKVLRSMERTIQKVCFNKFESGKGTAQNPFVISSTQNNTDTPGADEQWVVEKTSASQKFAYIKYIPSCFFRLDEDIYLQDYDDGSILPSNNWLGYDVGAVMFTGGINGLDKDLDEFGNPIVHTIHHYCSYDGYGMFYGIYGGVNTNLTSQTPEATNFYAQCGVIMNLKIEVSGYLLDTYTSEQTNRYAAILANEMNGGLLMNVEIYLGNDFGRETITITDPNLQPITFGTFVANAYAAEDYVSGTKTDENSYKNTVIKNCVSKVNVSILKTSSKAYQITKVGGIVGEAYGVNIYNCKNEGNLSAVRVAGIALEAKSMFTYEGPQFVKTLASSVVSGCENTGTLNAYPLNNTGAIDNSFSAGIVGIVENAFVVNSINWGTINVAPVESLYPDVTSTSKNVAVVGGVVASMNAGAVDELSPNVYAGGMANCFNFGKIMFNSADFDREDLDDGPSFFGGIVGQILVDQLQLDRLKMLTNYYDSTKNSSDNPYYIRAYGNIHVSDKKDLSQLEIENGQFDITDNDVVEANLIVGSITPNYYEKLSVVTKNVGDYPTITYI